MINAETQAAILAHSIPLSAPATKTAGGVKASNIEQVSQDFESMFISLMLDHMFGESLGTEAFGDKETADVYKSLITEAYAREITRAGGIGIASYVKAELLKLQEQEN